MVPANRLRIPKLKFYSQSRRGLCGIAVIRSVLATQFGIKESEEGILRVVYNIYRKKGRKEAKAWFEKYGVSPRAMAECFRKKIGWRVKVFCSKRGEVGELEHFIKQGVVPIMHQMVKRPEDGRWEGHYILFCGAGAKGRVRIFNPSPGKGFKELGIKEFYKRWQNKEERWFFGVLPEEVSLERERFKGKYI